MQFQVIGEDPSLLNRMDTLPEFAIAHAVGLVLQPLQSARPAPPKKNFLLETTPTSRRFCRWFNRGDISHKLAADSDAIERLAGLASCLPSPFLLHNMDYLTVLPLTVLPPCLTLTVLPVTALNPTVSYSFLSIYSIHHTSNLFPCTQTLCTALLENGCASIASCDDFNIPWLHASHHPVRPNTLPGLP